MLNSENLNPLLYWTDSYKISHIKFEIKGVKEIYSNFTARFDKYMAEMVGSSWDKKYVVFGVQYAIKEIVNQFEKGFFLRDKHEVITEMKDVLTPYIGWGFYEHFEALHDLGYLPVKIKSLPEGTLTPIGCPFMTVVNTHDDFEWLPNYLETIISTMVWKPLTIATMSRHFRLQTNKFAMRTNGNLIGTEWQNHDFHVRGGSGWESSAMCGLGFLLSSCGTDNIPSLFVAKNYYNSSNNEGLLAGSVSAGEHSVTTLGILTYQEENNCSLEVAEQLYLEYCLEQMPTGIFSYVADSFDYFGLLDNILPKVKNKILSRDGKFVVRGDSGNPVHIIAGYYIRHIQFSPKDMLGRSESELLLGEARIALANGYEVIEFHGKYFKISEDLSGGLLVEISRTEAIGTIEKLYEIFGGTLNDNWYKVLDSHIGMIYGDSINLERQCEILTRLEQKGFSSLNIVFGVGSYSLNLVGRDHLGMAIKATNARVMIGGIEVDKPIYKSPKTDTSKKSARGLLQVIVKDNEVVDWKDCVSREEEKLGDLRVVLENGVILVDDTIFDIRKRLWGK